MDLQANKAGAIYQKPARAVGRSAPPTPPIGCVLDFPGLPGAGNKIYDRSPYGNHGTIIGATWTRLPSGLWVMDFDGNDDEVVLGSAISLSGTYSFIYWVYREVNTNYHIVAGSTTVDTKIGFMTGEDTLFVRSVPAGSTDHTVAIATGEWNYVAITRDSSNKVDAYINDGSANRLFGDAAQSGTFGADRIGRDNTYSHDGYIALPRIYNRALSAGEIHNHYQQEKHLFGVW